MSLEKLQHIARELSLPSEHGIRRALLLANHGPAAATGYVRSVIGSLFQSVADGDEVTSRQIAATFDAKFGAMQIQSNRSGTEVIRDFTRYCLRMGASPQSLLDIAQGAVKTEVAALFKQLDFQEKKPAPSPSAAHPSVPTPPLKGTAGSPPLGPYLPSNPRKKP